MDTPPASPSSRDLNVVKVLYFVYYAAFGIFSAYSNLYFRGLGLSGFQIGWLSAIIPAVGVICGPLWSYLNDRLERPRAQLAIAGAGALAAVLAMSVPRTFLWLLPLAGLYSLFNSTVMPIIDTTNLALLGERRDRYGRQRVWGSVGYITAIWVVGQVIGALGLHWLFPAYAIAMLGLLAALFFLPDRRVRLALAPQGGLLEMVRQPRWLLFAVSILFLGVSISGMNNFLGVSLKIMGGSDRLVGNVLSLAAVAEMPVMFFSTVLIGRVGLKRMLVISFGAYSLRFALYAVMPSPLWALPISLMHGFTFGLYWVASIIYLNQLAPAHLKTTSQGLFMGIAYLSNVAGALIGGALLDHVGPSALFAIYAGCALTALAILLVCFRVAEAPAARPIPVKNE